MSRPEYVRCALRGGGDRPEETWCGRVAPKSEWAFLDASHAIANGEAGTALLLCRSCGAAIRKAVLVAVRGR